MTKVHGARLELFTISLLTLFLELACIRWFPSHVLFLTFFTNTVLLACILGISVGCLAANAKRSFLPYTPLMLIIGFASAPVLEWPRHMSNQTSGVVRQMSPSLVFLGVWFSCTIWFQWHDEFTSGAEIGWNVAGFLAGTTAITGILAVYFHLTNKDLSSFNWTPRLGSRLLFHQRLPSVREIQMGVTRWRVDTYLTERCHLRLVRSVAHYDTRVLEQVFRQNHWNAVVVLIVALFLLMVQGAFMDSTWARIPAGGTLFLFSSIVMGLYGAIRFWFRQWGTAVFLVLIFTVNLLTGWGIFNCRNRTYGLGLQKANRAVYTYAARERTASPQAIARNSAVT